MTEPTGVTQDTAPQQGAGSEGEGSWPPPQRVAEAFEAVWPLAEQLKPEQVERTPRLDLRAAAQVMFSAAQALSEDAWLMGVLRRMPSEALDAAHLDRLTLWAQALRHVTSQRAVADQRAGRRLIRAETVTEAKALRGRLLRMVDYHLGDHPEAAAQVAAIRQGSGHLDMADDLEQLAALAREHAQALASDKGFDPAQLDAAERLADDIYEQLGEPKLPAVWRARLRRVWTLARAAYEDVRAAALLVLRRDPEAAKRFPPLFNR